MQFEQLYLPLSLIVQTASLQGKTKTNKTKQNRKETPWISVRTRMTRQKLPVHNKHITSTCVAQNKKKKDNRSHTAIPNKCTIYTLVQARMIRY